MIDYDATDERLVVFGSIFTVSNRLQLVMDQQMPDISAKQWFVLTILSFFDSPPSLIGLAGACDTSYQNIKQIVLKLEKKGFVFLEEDKEDRRMKRIVTTPKLLEWKRKTDDQSAGFIETLFQPLSPDQVSGIKEALLILHERLGEMRETDKG